MTLMVVGVVGGILKKRCCFGEAACLHRGLVCLGRGRA